MVCRYHKELVAHRKKAEHGARTSGRSAPAEVLPRMASRRCFTMMPSSSAASRIGHDACGEMLSVSRTIAITPALATLDGLAMRRKMSLPLCASRCFASLHAAVPLVCCRSVKQLVCGHVCA